MSADLSFHHKPVGDFLDSSPVPSTPEGWAQLALGEAELREFEEKGYLANVQILSSEQVDALLAELEQIRTGEHPGHHHFHEFHSNESPDPSLDFMMWCTTRGWLASAASCWVTGLYACGTTSSSASLPITAPVSRGIKISRIGRELGRCPT